MDILGVDSRLELVVEAVEVDEVAVRKRFVGGLLKRGGDAFEILWARLVLVARRPGLLDREREVRGVNLGVFDRDIRQLVILSFKLFKGSLAIH